MRENEETDTMLMISTKKLVNETTPIAIGL